MLYMFQAVSLPIIRSSELCTQHLVYVKLLAATASVGEYIHIQQHIQTSSNTPTLAVAASKPDKYQMLCAQF
jgi:hypothetical protein